MQDLLGSLLVKQPTDINGNLVILKNDKIDN